MSYKKAFVLFFCAWYFKFEQWHFLGFTSFVQKDVCTSYPLPLTSLSERVRKRTEEEVGDGGEREREQWADQVRNLTSLSHLSSYLVTSSLISLGSSSSSLNALHIGERESERQQRWRSAIGERESLFSLLSLQWTCLPAPSRLSLHHILSSLSSSFPAADATEKN